MSKSRTLVWDIHTRLFHWLLVLSVAYCLISGLSDSMDLMEWHMVSGQLVLGLLVFRVLTGIFGRDYGHFSHLRPSISEAKAYIRRRRQQQAVNSYGHNPLGKWSVIVMLVVLLVQTLSGLLTTDDMFFEGPWVYMAGEQLAAIGTLMHDVNWKVVAAVIALHIGAILYYRIKLNENLVGAMITGHKLEQPDQGVAQRISMLRLVVLIASASALAWVLLRFGQWF